MSADEEKTDSPADKLPKDGAAALSALRNLWGATGREREFFQTGGGAGGGGSESGKSVMEQIVGEIGFGGLETFAEDGEATTNTYEAGKRLSSAWKKTMEREGKLMHPGQSVSDLMAAQRDGLQKGTPAEKMTPAKKSPFFDDEELSL